MPFKIALNCSGAACELFNNIVYSTYQCQIHVWINEYICFKTLILGFSTLHTTVQVQLTPQTFHEQGSPDEKNRDICKYTRVTPDIRLVSCYPAIRPIFYLSG